jgi:AcrR family transcriptional regulator
MDSIAQRAGVSKATIYRWWSSKGALALDAFLAEVTAALGPPPNTGSLRGDLRRHIRSVVAAYGRTAAGKMLAELVGAFPTDPTLAADFRSKMVVQLRDRNRVIFEHAVARGEIAADTDVHLAMDVLYGAIWIRLLMGFGTLDERFADALVELVVEGLEKG